MTESIADKRYTDIVGNLILLEIFTPKRIEKCSLNHLWSCRFRISRNAEELIDEKIVAERDGLDAFLGAMDSIRDLLNELEPPLCA